MFIREISPFKIYNHEYVIIQAYLVHFFISDTYKIFHIHRKLFIKQLENYVFFSNLVKNQTLSIKMKKLLAGFFVFAITSSWILSQDQSIEDEKKVYKSEENNRLYVNKDLGIYLWLSTSPDSNAEKIRLMSESSKKYSNPMFFDTEGYNTVRSPWRVDTTTKIPIYPREDIIFEVYADGLPPFSRSVFRASSSTMIGGKKYYGSDLQVEIHASDAVSGIESIKYSFNDKPFTEYKEELTGFKEGENILIYYSTDNVGNKEKTTEKVFYIDNTPPTTDFVIDGMTNEKYVSANTTIQLTSTDSLSGVKAIYYRINSGDINRYYKPIPVSLLAAGAGTISFYAVDNLGNKETEQVIGGKESALENETSSTPENITFEFYVDRDPPEIKLSVENDIYNGKYDFISSRSKIKIEAKDEKAGVEKILYSINSNILDNEYSEPFAIDIEGLKYLRIKASDYVGNVSPVQIHAYFCDITPPTTSVTISSPKYASRDTLFVSDKTKISINASDNQSEIKEITYYLNSEESIVYNSPFTITKPGFHMLSWTSSDNVNNTDAVKTQQIFVDNIPPVIHYHFSVESIGNKTIRDEVYTIYPTNTMLYIAATDASSGGEKIEYKINEGSKLTANPIKGLIPGNYLVEIEAFDVLGNKSIKEIKFAIEK